MHMNVNASNEPDDGESGIDQSRLQPLLGWHVTRAELHLSRKLIEHLLPFALRPVDFFILMLIDSNHGIHQRQIGDTLGISPPNLVGVITRLVKKRLLRRTRGRQDRRIQHLYLTPAGSERLNQAEAALFRFEHEHLTARLPLRDQEILRNALQRLITD